jgi:hypothetical protein
MSALALRRSPAAQAIGDDATPSLKIAINCVVVGHIQTASCVVESSLAGEGSLLRIVEAYGLLLDGTLERRCWQRTVKPESQRTPVVEVLSELCGDLAVDMY